MPGKTVAGIFDFSGTGENGGTIRPTTHSLRLRIRERQRLFVPRRPPVLRVSHDPLWDGVGVEAPVRRTGHPCLSPLCECGQLHGPAVR